jgi:hypothetical protein
VPHPTLESSAFEVPKCPVFLVLPLLELTV